MDGPPQFIAQPTGDGTLRITAFSDDSPDPIQLEVDWDGTVIWNGTPVQLNALEGYFRVEAAKNPQPEVHVRPNRRANYDTVAKVLALAQRNGMQRIGFVGNEQFME